MLVLGGLGALSLDAGAQEVPFTGVVVDDRVEVRAGPGRAYYVVGELEQGDRVRVEQVLFGWNKIVAPDSTYSYISQAFVNAQGDGSTGVVNADRREVKAGALNGPGLSYKTQAVLNRGDRVTILAEEGDHYRIAPPDEAHVYLPPGSIRRANQLADLAEQAEPEAEPAEAPPVETPAPPAAAESDAAEATPDAEPTPTAEPAAESDPEALTAAGPVTPSTAEAVPPPGSEVTAEADPPAADTPESIVEEPDQPEIPTVTLDTEDREAEPDDLDVEMAKGQDVTVEAETDALAELEARAIPMLKRPVEEQPIDELIAAYRDLLAREDVELSRNERQLVGLRIAVLQRNAQLRDALTRIEETRRAAASPAAEAGGTRANRPARTSAAGDFDAVGRLLASSVYDGRSLPRMFRLVDPTARRTLAYVAPADVDPSAMLGKLVGVVGTSQYDPSLKLRVFEVESIEVLDGER